MLFNFSVIKEEFRYVMAARPQQLCLSSEHGVLATAFPVAIVDDED
jgi:hypothetical protein